ncbi:dihydroneopterin aldolase family protein [Halococcus agarilyticus]|uniref:dihydroneopterin aldolase family protein n=1 Tax=Halococcus agarilyticus TaxID=1232219 RepID=UPI000677A585|nr:dihydroneopterin aldolase family protein [Halococcus agarilyticus]
MTTDSEMDTASPTDAETACFEAGIKFGALYHQFAGTPVSPASAASLERAIEDAIENQPHCESVSVAILTDELDAAIDHGYTELTGRFMEVELVVEFEKNRVTARMAMEEGYPRMRIASVEALD